MPRQKPHNDDMCFQEAFNEFWEKKIAEEKYLEILVAHFRQGVIHPADRKRTRHSARQYEGTEIYAQSIRHASVEKKYTKPESVVEIETIFQACLIGDLELVQGNYEKLMETVEGPQVPVIQPLATLAVQKCHAQILKFCLAKIGVPDFYLKYAVEQNFYKSLEIVEVLYEADWRRMKSAKKVLNEMALICVDRAHDGTSDVLEFLLGHGANLPPHAVKTAMFQAQASSSLMKRFIDMEPIAALSPQALTYAASRGFADVVRQILDSGMDPDSRRPDVDISDAREPHQFTALYEAVTGGNGVWEVGEGHLETAKLLLERGGNADEECRTKALTPFRAAKRSKNAAMIELLEPYSGLADGYIPEHGPPSKRRRL